MLLKIWMNLRGATRWDEEAKVFVGYCPALKLYSQGKTEEEAKDGLNGAIALFVSTCFERGILERTLTEAGFAQMPTAGASPRDYMAEFIAIEEAKYDEVFDLNIPIQLIAAQRAAECQP